jgi:predicted MPP superfamily phosphohydrolase
VAEIKILHLSDLHFDSSKPKDTQIILDALWKDLDIYPGIDFILFSGDLVKAGDKKDDFEKAFQSFIKPLLEKTCLNEDKFFIVPGNHEIQLSQIKKLIESGLQEMLKDRDSLNEFLDGEMKNGFENIERLDHFNDFKTRFNSRHTVTSNKLFSTHIIEKGNVKIGIACLNSTWRATGRGGNYDKGKLLIGERQIDDSLNDIKECKIKIALYHHSLDWLTEYDLNDVKKSLPRKFDLLFCGHLHDANLELVQSFENKAVLVQGGCLYKGRSYYNSYSVLSIDPLNNDGTLYLRTYFDGREKFDKAIDRCDNGTMPVTMKIVIPPHERVPFTASVLDRITKKQEWALELAAQLNSKINHSQAMYLECSSQSVSRKLGKLETLLEIDGILNEDEREVLVAAQYLHSLNSLGEDLIKSKNRLCEIANISEDFATASAITADAVHTDFDLDSSDMKIGNIRCDLLAALLRVGKILDFDREAITNRNCPPPTQDFLDHWRAFLTKQVIIRRGGLVTFHLLVSKNQEKQNDLFIRFIALSFEALWQKLRKILTHNGVAISRAPSRITVSPDIGKLPGSILRQLEQAIKEAEESIPRLLHLGDSPPAEFSLSQIVPLPFSAIVNPLSFRMERDHDYNLILMQMDDNGGYPGQPIKIPFGGRQEVLLSPADMLPSSTYRWWIIRNNGDFESTVTTGCLRTLSAAEINRWKMVNESSDKQQRREVQLNLGLWNDIMTEIWPKLIPEGDSFEEIVLLHHGLLLAFEWLKENSASSSQVDLFRTASQWVRSLFIKNKDKEI